MRTFKVLALLLLYPEREWLERLDELRSALEAEARGNRRAAARLAPLFERLSGRPLVSLQEDYVALFDREPAHSLHLYEHLHGDSRGRGPAMAELVSEYRRSGYELAAAELPDYLPLFLEYLSLLPEREAHARLAEARPVVSALGGRLRAAGSPYHSVFEALARL